MTRADFDNPWKNVLNQFLPAFVAFCLPDAAAAIDWSRGYTSLDKELTAINRQQEVGKRMADALFKVWLKSGNEVWLLLHIEVQSQEEANFPERMYIYNYRIFDRYQKPVISIAILADDNPHWRPQYYERVTHYTRLRLDFGVVKLLDYAQQKQVLSQESNPFAIVVWAHLEALQTREQPQQRLLSKLAITRALYEHGFSKDYIINLFCFIDWLLALPPPLELEYTQTIEQIEEEKHVNYITSVERIGMQRGEQIGMQKGERLLLDRLLKHRFGSLPANYQRLLQEADAQKLLSWAESLLEAKTLEDVFNN